jgi:hypothetical protein
MGVDVQQDVHQFGGKDDASDDEPFAHDDMIKDLKHALKQSVIGSRNNLQYALMKELTPEQKTEYKALKKHGPLKEFRLKWARMKLKNLTEEKESTRTLTKTKLDIGVYLPFAIIVKRKGGSRPLGDKGWAHTLLKMCTHGRQVAPVEPHDRPP